MSQAVVGLSCPKCQGKIKIKEGERIIICPYCDQRSFVKGSRGVGRYQIQRSVDYERARQVLSEFWSGSDRADALQDEAQIVEIFTVYLPFWAIWTRVAAWIFRNKRRAMQDRKTAEYEERKYLRDLHWNGPACDVVEFGVDAVQLEDRLLEFYDPNTLNLDGMVFEPIGSEQEPRRNAYKFFEEEVTKDSKSFKISSIQMRFLRERLGLVYYPLWIARYSFLDRTYQLVIDGYSGNVLYGKAPGNPWHRAAVLILSMALGVFFVVWGSGSIIKVAFDGGLDCGVFAILPIIFGVKIMRVGYTRYVHGEEIVIRAQNPLRPRKSLISVLLDKPLSLDIDR